MQETLVLDLSGPHAALIRLDRGAWVRLAAVALASADPGRTLADTVRLLGRTGCRVWTLLPDDQVAAIARADRAGLAPALATAGVTRESHVVSSVDAAPDGAGEIVVLAVPCAVVAEAEAFVTAIGLRPNGVLGRAAPGGVLVPLAGGLDAVDPHTPLPPLESAGTVQGDEADVTAPARRRAIRAAQSAPAVVDDAVADIDDDPETAARRAEVLAGFLRQIRSGRWERVRRHALRAVAMAAGLAALLVAGAAILDRQTPTVADADGLATLSGNAATPSASSEPLTGPTGAIPPDPPLAATGNAPETPVGPAISLRATLYTPTPGLRDGVAGDDLAELVQPGLDATGRIDANALPVPARATPAPPAATLLPPPPVAEIGPPVDADGLVIPAPEGQRAPGGYTVFAGEPPALPPARPLRTEADLPLVVITDRSVLAADDPLRRLDPRARPSTLVARAERAQLGGRTRDELAQFGPEARPASAQDAEPETPPTPQAIATGPRPQLRTQAAREAFQTARAAAATGSPDRATPEEPAPVVQASAVASPSAPTPDAVQRSATASGRIDLSEVNLLGTFGSRGSPRALVRLPGGRVVNVEVGDRIDGGRVAAIRSGELDYTKGGRTRSLSLPRL